MQYIREQFPECFVIRASSLEEAKEINKTMKSVGVLPVGEGSNYFWAVYSKNTLYYIEKDNMLYGNLSHYQKSVADKDESYLKLIYYDSFINFLANIAETNYDDYAIY
jgi:hypothetical protein